MDNLPLNTAPYFSVVLTTYNRASLLSRALQSLIFQTETDWEAILIDDGSTDDTSLMVQQFLKEDQRIRYYHFSPSGATAAKNKGIRLSRGKYITFLDSDDEFHPSHLKLRREFLEKHPGVLFLHGGVQIIGNPFVPDMHDYDRQIHLSGCAIGGTFFIARQLADEIGEFATIPLGSDAEYLERVIQKGYPFKKIDNPTYIYHREVENSITNNLMKKGTIR